MYAPTTTPAASIALERTFERAMGAAGRALADRQRSPCVGDRTVGSQGGSCRGSGQPWRWLRTGQQSVATEACGTPIESLPFPGTPQHPHEPLSSAVSCSDMTKE